MENRYLLLVSNNEKSFTANALYESLTKADFEVRNVAITDTYIGNYIDSAFGVIIASSYENTYALGTIQKKCFELNRKVILFGNPNEIEAMKRTITESVIFKELLRPVEMDEVCNCVRRLKEKAENSNEMKKILVVDDNGVMLRTIMGWLEGRYKVTLANSAAIAMESIKKTVPDLILLDYEMPVCSGAQFMEKLAADSATKDIPIIFLTSRNDAETVKEVMALKPKGYVLKTTPQDKLLKKIEDYFDSAE